MRAFFKGIVIFSIFFSASLLHAEDEDGCFLSLADVQREELPTTLHRYAEFWTKDLARPMQRYKTKGSEVWETITALTQGRYVQQGAAFFEDMNFRKGDVLLIHGSNRPEWTNLALSAQLVGGIAGGVYLDAAPEEILYSIKLTGAKVFAADTMEQLKRIFGEDFENLPPSVEQLIVFDDPPASDKLVFDPRVVVYADMLKLTAVKRPFERYLSKIDANDPAIVFFTSGTTSGKPKAALWAHEALVSNADNAINHWGLGELRRHRLISFMPMNHIMETVQNLGAAATVGAEVFYNSGASKLKEELPEVQPTVALFPPKAWNLMFKSAKREINKVKGTKRKLVDWAFSAGKKAMDARLDKTQLSRVDRIQYFFADRLVLSKIRHKLGLGRAMVLASGSAPLRPELIEWFHGLGIEILEGYGQSEHGISFMTNRGERAAGTVGNALKGIDVRFTEDGILQVKVGKNTMLRYMNDPEKTAEVIREGWLHTGDIFAARTGNDGKTRYSVEGRDNDRIKLMDGLYYLPLPIETEIKNFPMVEDVSVVGNGRQQLTALIVLDSDIMERMRAVGKVDGKIVRDDEMTQQIQKLMTALNKKLRQERIGGENGSYIANFRIISSPFTEKNGEITKSLKQKRHIIERNYKDVIDEMSAKDDN